MRSYVRRTRLRTPPIGRGPIGDPSGPIGLSVELFLGALGWTDISAFVLYRDSSQLVDISRGRPNETGSITAQTASLQINNRDGRFSPRNQMGPYFGYIGRNTQIRISRMQNGARRYRFVGEVPSWPTTWDISGTDVWVDIAPAGQWQRLQQGTQQLGSAMFRAYALKEAGSLNPVAYWPCEDGATALSFASGLPGNPVMTFSGTAQLASSSAFMCSLPLPVTNASTWSGRVAAGSWTDNVCRFLMAVPSGGETDGAVIASMFTVGTVARADLIYRTGGGLQLTGFDSRNNTLVDTGLVTGFPLDATPQRVSLELIASGGNVKYQIEALQVGATLANLTSGTLSSAVIGAVTQVVINPNGTLTGTAIGHVSVQPLWDSLFDLVSQLNAWNGEGPNARFGRLLAEQGLNPGNFFPDFSKIDGNNAVAMGYQLSDTFANLVQQIADTDLCMIYEAVDQAAIVRRSRIINYNQGTAYNNTLPSLTLDCAQNQFSGPLDPLDDDAYTRNDITVQRLSGSFAQATASSGPLSTQPPPAGVGDYATTYSLSVDTDAHTADHAGWRLHMGTVDEPRYPRVKLNLRHPQFTGNLALLNQALTLDIGDLVVINNPPAWMAPDQIRLIVQGYSETLGVFEHNMVLNCSPEAPYRVAMLEDPILGHADTDGASLTGALGPVLNSNPYFSGGSAAGWAATNCALTVAGTSGSAAPLPPGGPTGYGALVTPNGAGGPSIAQSGALFPVMATQAYYASALFYYPSGLQPIIVGVAWFDASQSFISTSSGFASATAATWTALSSGSLTAPANAAFGAPFAALGNVPSAGDVFYAVNIVAWQGAVTVATTTAGSPLWTTAGADFPFDIGVSPLGSGGERMTVTGITGGSSPQTFTVARAVNGVGTALPAGRDVRLWQPMVLSL